MKLPDSVGLRTWEHIAVIKPCHKTGWHFGTLNLMYFWLNTQCTDTETASSENQHKVFVTKI